MSATCRVWRFGDNVNTDAIIPGKYLGSYDPAHLASHAMEGISKDFVKRVSKGDVIVAGRNFGCGSSREQAVIALKHAGVSAIIAQSFSRIFYRNAINLALPVFISKDASELFSDGDEGYLIADDLRLSAKDKTKSASLEPMPEHLKEILDAGGLVPFVKRRLEGR